MDYQNTPSEPVAETPAQAPEPAPAPVEPVYDQPTGSDPANTPPTVPESPINDSASIPVESDNSGPNQPESEGSEVQQNEAPISEPIQAVPIQSAPISAPMSPTPLASQPQSSAQPDQNGFIRALLAKANAKIQSKRQKKLELIMQSVLKKGKTDNREAQKLLRISDKTAERYLNRLVMQGRLKRSGAGRDVIYTL